jgi:hypothetical protein
MCGKDQVPSKYFNIYPQNEVFQCYHIKAAVMQMHVDQKGIGECLAYLTQNRMVPEAVVASSTPRPAHSY